MWPMNCVMRWSWGKTGSERKGVKLSFDSAMLTVGIECDPLPMMAKKDVKQRHITAVSKKKGLLNWSFFLSIFHNYYHTKNFLCSWEKNLNSRLLVNFLGALSFCFFFLIKLFICFYPQRLFSSHFLLLFFIFVFVTFLYVEVTFTGSDDNNNFDILLRLCRTWLKKNNFSTIIWIFPPFYFTLEIGFSLPELVFGGIFTLSLFHSVCCALCFLFF